MEQIISASSITYYLIVFLILMAGGGTFVSGFLALYINTIKVSQRKAAEIRALSDKNFSWDDWEKEQKEQDVTSKMKLKNGKLGGLGEWAYEYSDKWYWFFPIGIGLIIIGIIMIII